MRMSEVEFGDIKPIEGYGPGFFRIGGKVHEGALLLTPSGPRAWAGFDDEAPLLALAGEIDVIFFGTGAEIAHLPAALRSRIEGAGMGAEIMNSPAACRTWNVLAAEGRRVAIAALPL